MTYKWKSWDIIDPEKYYGFVYKITNEKTGQFYIGKKVYWNNKKHKLTKKQLAEQTGPGRKPTFEVIRTESDWKTYWGWIYRQCSTKKQLTYYEMHHQCKEECLFNSYSYNDNILGKFFRKDLIEAK